MAISIHSSGSSKRWYLAVWAVWAMLIGICIGSPGHVGHVYAQTQSSPQAQAKAHYKRGRAYHDLQEYDKAIREYLEAYRLSKAPGLLYNLAQAYRLNGDKRMALHYYQRYVTLQPKGQVRRVAEQQIKQLSKDIAAEDAEKAREAAKARKAAKQPREAAKAREVTARTKAREGQNPESPEVTRATMDTTTDAATRQPKSGLEPRQILRYSGATVAAAGALSMVLVGKYYLDAQATSNDLEGVIWTEDSDLRFREGQAIERRMNRILAIGGGAIVVGTVLYVVGHFTKADTKSERLEATLRLSPDSGSVVLLGHF